MSIGDQCSCVVRGVRTIYVQGCPNKVNSRYLDFEMEIHRNGWEGRAGEDDVSDEGESTLFDVDEAP